MANDNDNRPKNPILSREPNSLDKIGSRDYTKSHLSDIAMMERRASIETVEMRRLQQRMADIDRIRQENARRAANVLAGMSMPTEQMFREAGVRSEVASEIMTKMSGAPNQIASAYTTAVGQFDVKLSGRRSQYEEQHYKLKELAQVNAARLFAGRVISVAGSEAGFKTLGRDPNVMAEAERYAGVASDVQLMRGYERTRTARHRAGIELEQAAQLISTPGGQEEYLNRAQIFEEKRRKEAALQQAMGLQNRRGISVSGMQESGARIQAAILEEQRQSALSQRVSSGATGSLRQESAELKNREQEFLKTLAALNEEFKRTGDVSKDMREAFSANKDALKEQKDLVDEMKRQGGGGGGRLGRMMMGIDIARQVVGVASYAGVGADVEQMNVRLGAAQFANQRYTDQYAASQGDMAALRRAMTRQQDAAAAFGRAYGNRAVTAAGADVGLDVASAGLKGFAMYASGGLLAPVLGASTAGDIASATTGATRIGKGITFGQQQQLSAQQYQQLMDTVNQVPDVTRQRFVDYRMSAYQSMMGAGSAFSGMYGGATSQKAIETLAGQGLTPEEGAALYGVGARAIGAQFTRAGAGTQLSTVSRAGQLQSLGVMSAQEYMGRIGQMAQTGGGQKDVEDVLAAAVARGVDDAKSLSGMFESVQALSRDAASKGVGVAPIVGAQMAFGMQQLKDLPRDEMLKQAQVMSGLGRLSQMATTTGIDFATMSAMAGLGRISPGLSKDPLGRAAILSTPIEVMRTQMRELSKYEGKEVPAGVLAGLQAPSAFVNEKGVYDPEITKKIIAERLTSQIAGRAAGLISPEQLSKISQAITSGKGIESLDKETIKTIRNVYGAGAAEFMAFGGEGEGVERKGLGPLTGGAESARRMRESQARGQTSQIVDAGRLAGGMDKLADAISTQMESVVTSMNALTAATESAKAAEAMKLDASAFDASVGKFDIAVDKLVTAITPMLSGSMPVDQRFLDRTKVQGK